LDNLRQHECFVDYIKHSCKTADELKKVLDLEVTCECDETSSLLKYVTSGCKNKCEDCYYSLCRGQVVHEDRGVHCDSCRQCFDQHYWHCGNCDRCSFGQSIGQCEWCGFNPANLKEEKSKILPQPLSTHLNSLMMGMPDMDDEAEPDEKFHSDVESEIDAPEWHGWIASELTEEVYQNAEVEMLSEMHPDGEFSVDDLPPGFSPFGMPPGFGRIPPGFGMPSGFGMPPGFGGPDVDEEVLLNAFANAMAGMGMARDMFGPDDEENDEDAEDYDEEDEYYEEHEDEEEETGEPHIHVHHEDENEEEEQQEEDGSVHRRRRNPPPGGRGRGGPQGGQPINCAQQ